MGMYFGINLFKNIKDTDAFTVVKSSVDALLKSECRYKTVTVSTIEDTTVSYRHFRYQQEVTKQDLKKAIFLASRDIANWQKNPTLYNRLPLVDVNFEASFRFTKRALSKLTDEEIREYKRVSLFFWVRKNDLFGEYVNISVSCNDYLVLCCGQEKHHIHNEKILMNIITNLVQNLNPYYGWADGEMNSADGQFRLIGTDYWNIRNAVVVVGKPLDRMVPEFPKKVYKKLDNGCVIYHAGGRLGS